MNTFGKPLICTVQSSCWYILYTRGGGGGYCHNMYAYWVCAANEIPIFSHEFPFRSISFFRNYQKNPFRSITILHFMAEFAVPETIIFKISLISTHSSPPTAAAQRVRQRRGLAAVPEIRIFKRSGSAAG